MQRYCDGCRCHHDLSAFDLDRDEANAVCRARRLQLSRTAKASARRKKKSKIESLENRRRELIAALVQIDQEIALERASQEGVSLLRGLDLEDAFGADGDGA